MDAAPGLRWDFQRETRFPFGPSSPMPERVEAIGFPPPWPERPWVYGVMVCSANGVVAWRRTGPADDPVLAVLGGDSARPERLADRWLMRSLRCFGDVAIGAQTVRDQPGLLQTPVEPGEPPAPELYRFRVAHGLAYQPRHIVYSRGGRLDLSEPLFNTPGVEAMVVTSEAGAAGLTAAGAAAKGVGLIAEDVDRPEGLRRAHQRLFAEHGIRYLSCEGGEVLLEALLRAGLLDEVFLTVTDVRIDESRHQGVRKILDLAAAGAELIAEGRVGAQSAWRFQRWRLSRA
jgi:riboflavin biosynthesis pyrimidine reductase